MWIVGSSREWEAEQERVGDQRKILCGNDAVRATKAFNSWFDQDQGQHYPENHRFTVLFSSSLWLSCVSKISQPIKGSNWAEKTAAGIKGWSVSKAQERFEQVFFIKDDDYLNPIKVFAKDSQPACTDENSFWAGDRDGNFWLWTQPEGLKQAVSSGGVWHWHRHQIIRRID